MSKIYDYYIDEYGGFVPYDESPLHERGYSNFRGRRKRQHGGWEEVIEDVEQITGEVLDSVTGHVSSAMRSPIMKEAAVHTGVFACKLALFLIIRNSQLKGIELNGHL